MKNTSVSLGDISEILPSTGGRTKNSVGCIKGGKTQVVGLLAVWQYAGRSRGR